MVNERQPALLLKIQTLRDSLSRAERKMVDYVLENPEKVIYLSVAGLAEQSGVSEATVVRTCRRIGLNGYQEFKVTLAQDIVTPLQSINEEIDEGDDDATIVNKVFQSTLHALTFTHDILDIPAVSEAAEAINQASRVVIMGLGNSHSVAIDLRHKLLRLGIHASVYTDSHLQAIVSTTLAEDDVLFSISHSGSSIDIVNAATLAKERGAKVISLTNMGNSPLSKISDICLHTASKETHYRIVALSSRVAQIAIIDAIYTLIAVRCPERAKNFHDVERALQKTKY